MPDLRDTEWRLLCVIVRQTLGWQLGTNSTQRKRRDWITREQLKARTGRDSEALAKAVDVLVKKNYLIAESEAGLPLATPSDRRNHRARVYYRLEDRFHPNTSPPKSELESPSPCSLMRGSGPEIELNSAAKANRTKEKRTKEIVTKRASSFFQKQAGDPHIHGYLNQESLRLKAIAKGVFPKENNSFGNEATGADCSRQAPLSGIVFLDPTGKPIGLSAIADEFRTLFTDLAGQLLGQSADIHLSPEDRTRLEKLLQKYEGRNWKPVLELFFRCDLGHVRRRHYSLQAFLDSCNLFLLRIPGAVSLVTHRTHSGGWRKSFD